MIISATTEQHRLHKHHSGETIGNCEQLCRTTYYYFPGHSLVSTTAYLALPFVSSPLMPLYSSVCLSLTNHKPPFQISKATNNIHLFLSCRAFVSLKDSIVRYFVFWRPWLKYRQDEYLWRVIAIKCLGVIMRVIVRRGPGWRWRWRWRVKTRGWVYDCESVACESIRRSQYRRLP
jgi:hypothetical protein